MNGMLRDQPEEQDADEQGAEERNNKNEVPNHINIAELNAIFLQLIYIVHIAQWFVQLGLVPNNAGNQDDMDIIGDNNNDHNDDNMEE